MSRWREQLGHLFIGGEWVAPANPTTNQIVSPFTEEVVATTALADQEDVRRAVAVARQTFEHGTWSRRDPAERIAVLRGFSELYRERHEEFAQTITEEMGCPISISRPVQASVPQLILDTYLEVAEDYAFRQVRRGRTGAALVTKEPVGVVAGIVPWNVPQSTGMNKLAPALIAGCSIILKPTPETALDAYLLAEIIAESDLPRGVVSILPADREVSEYLVTRPDVDKVAFTGSTAAGRRIAALCGHDLRRMTLELGGKSAAIILDDADLDSTIESLRLGALRNSGQVCSLKTRIVVPRRNQDEIVDRLTALLASMPVGDPSDESTQIGPMASQRHRSVVEGFLDSGREEGATVAVGGGRPRGLTTGWFVEPTVFVDVTPEMRIAQEEIFGPVLSVLAYDDEDQAVAIANNSTYGLNGAVYTSDVEHGLDLAQRIRTGTVEVNGSPAGLRAPAGGFKASGIGREGGPEGLESYLEARAIGLDVSAADTVEKRLSSVSAA